jgi:hypothetical protein
LPRWSPCSPCSAAQESSGGLEFSLAAQIVNVFFDLGETIHIGTHLGVQLGDFVCHVGVHVPPAQPRKKALWDLFSAPERIDRNSLEGFLSWADCDTTVGTSIVVHILEFFIASISPRKKALWDLFSAPERIDRDLELAKRLTSKLDSEMGANVDLLLREFPFLRLPQFPLRPLRHYIRFSASSH